MQYKHVLVTGGAGFIGSFLVDSLIKKGYKVRILDNLEKQVHQNKIPSYLNQKAEFIKGDVRDYEVFEKALSNVDVVFHLAARVGVAQSNYEIKDYTDTNIGGMANLFDIIVNKKKNIKKVVMTASMTSYGEGNYRCMSCGVVKPDLRREDQMKKGRWELECPNCESLITPVATKEEASVNNNSIYALTKNVQEELLLLLGKLYKIPVVSLRCFNVYGPRQSLANPYTGVTAIFIARLKNNKSPVIYEDGMQTRDFISVHDVVDGLIKVMEGRKADYQIMNMGSGTPISITDIAKTLALLLKKNIKPILTYKFRKNDIRNCFADISKAEKILGWKPKITLKDGMKELITWSEQEESNDLFEKAEKELRAKKLL